MLTGRGGCTHTKDVHTLLAEILSDRLISGSVISDVSQSVAWDLNGRA
jgi:hypothetical protein